ncbi:MAG: type II toxin-antitoxin system HicB family antitoxin [Lachnospiraceae bacterium]|nr:type II toxin-antitoxin system HicB family antitoxin [Lachnospiraceae bacterium]
MSKYSFPAVFTPEENGGYSVNFPDLESCYTCGDDMTDAIMMAEDVLSLTLYNYEISERTIPAPSSPADISLSEGELINYIACSTLEYRKRFSNAAVKKTLTIPEWMNDEALRAGINFSQVLQDALKQQLHIG